MKLNIAYTVFIMVNIVTLPFVMLVDLVTLCFLFKNSATEQLFKQFLRGREAHRCLSAMRYIRTIQEQIDAEAEEEDKTK